MSLIRLLGYAWHNPARNALFAFTIITVVILVLCIFLASNFKWVYYGERDRLRTVLYVTSTISLLIYMIIQIVDVGISESRNIIDVHYVIIYIFGSFFFRIGEFFILLVLLRTTLRSLSNDAKPSWRSAHSVPLVLAGALIPLAAVSIGTWGTNVAYNSTVVNGGNYLKILPINTGFASAYDAVYLFCTCLLFSLAIVALKLQRFSTPALITQCAVIALWFRALFNLITIAITNYSHTRDLRSLMNLSLAEMFIYLFTSMFIYIAVAIVAIMTPARELREVAVAPAGYASTGYVEDGIPRAPPNARFHEMPVKGHA